VHRQAIVAAGCDKGKIVLATQCRDASLNSTQGRRQTRATKKAPAPPSLRSPQPHGKWPNFRTLNSSRLRHFDPCPHAATASLDFHSQQPTGLLVHPPPAFPTSSSGATKGHPGSLLLREWDEMAARHGQSSWDSPQKSEVEFDVAPSWGALCLALFWARPRG